MERKETATENTQSPTTPNAVDEMNLAEFPLAGISDRRLSGQKTVTFEEQIFDRDERKMVQRRLVLSGSDRFGLPTAKDDDVLLACIQLSKLQEFESREVRFSRYEILKLLRMSQDSNNYARIATSLRRWKGLTIFSDRAFYDHGAKSWVNRDFGIFDSLFIYHREPQASSATRSTSRFVWNEVIFNSFRSGYLKRFDWNLYTSLESAVAKRLYRFLDKRFYHSSTFEIDLFELAVNRIGIADSGHTGTIKRTLLTGISELEQKWDLKAIGPDKRFTKQARGQWIVRFQRKRTVRPTIANPSQKLESHPTDVSTLITQLTRRGIGPAAAEELAMSRPSTTISTMIELFDWYNQRGQTRGAGFLVQSIKSPSGILFPSGFESSAQAQSRRLATKQAAIATKEVVTKREQAAEQVALTRAAAFNSYWQNLSPAEQAEFEEKAVEAAEPTKRAGYWRSQAKQDRLFEQYRLVVLTDHYHRRIGSLHRKVAG